MLFFRQLFDKLCFVNQFFDKMEKLKLLKLGVGGAVHNPVFVINLQWRNCRALVG